MGRLILAVAGCLLAMSTASWAQSATQDFTLEATAETSCALDGSAGTTRTVVISAATSTPMGVVSGGPSTITVTCNGASSVELSSLNDGLLLSGAAEKATDSGMDNFIDYTASIDGGAGAVTLDTSDAGTDPAEGPYAESAIAGSTQTITITPAAGNPLLPGSYSDTLTVTVSPEV